METLVYVLAIFLFGIVVAVLVIWSTQRRAEPPDLSCLGSVTEPEARLWVNRLKSEGIWADLRDVGGVAVLSLEFGSGGGYEVWVRSGDAPEARRVLGLARRGDA